MFPRRSTAGDILFLRVYAILGFLRIVFPADIGYDIKILMKLWYSKKADQSEWGKITYGGKEERN